MTRKVKLEESPKDCLPICPHCKRELNTLYVKTSGFIEKHEVIFCPNCRSFLGFSTSNLF